MLKKVYLLLLVLFLFSSTLGYATDNNNDWLSVKKNIIVDAQGNPVRLTGINWFGFNCNERVFHGLWCMNLDRTLKEVVADRGFNILRIPMSTMLIDEWMNDYFKYIYVNQSENPHLQGMNSLEIFDYTLMKCKELGIKVMIDIHHADDNNSGHLYPVWYKGSITPEIFYATLEWMAERYKDDDTIIAYDLENEPHGNPARESLFAKWDDSTDINNWKHAAETAAARILAKNPNVLILVEGIEVFPKDGVSWDSTNESDYHYNWWGGNLRGVKTLPIDLGEFQHKLVYSPHDYGPVVYEQPWFQDDIDTVTEEKMYNDCWGPNWYYIVEDQTAPLLIGEWGGKTAGTDDLTLKNVKWLNLLKDFMIKKQLHHTFWCLNCNSGDTGGILIDWNQNGDLKYEIDEDKYVIVEPTLWQDRNGKFVSLDHNRPLGSWATGTTIGKYYEDGNIQPIPPEAGATITVSSPINGTVIPADTDINIKADLDSPTGETASKVEIYIDNSLENTDTFVPYIYNWTNPSDGAHKIKAIAYLDNGDIIESQTVNIMVGNYISVNITEPAFEQVFHIGDTANIIAEINTNVGGTPTVQFCDILGNVLKEDTSAPYTYEKQCTTVGQEKIIVKANISDGSIIYEDSKEITYNVQLPSLILKYLCANTAPSGTNLIKAQIKLINRDNINYDYEDIKVRYYFTSQDINSQAFNCWHAVIGAQNVIGSFGTENGNDYLEVSFKEGLPSLVSNDENGSGEIQLAIHDVNWQENYNQTDDYSFNPEYSNYAEYDKITVYYKGKLVWGMEP